MKSFDLESRARFEEKLVLYFAKAYPRECRQAGGPEQIRKLVAGAIDRATGFGFQAEAQVSLFVALCFILGSDFDRDPQIAWAGEMLRDAGVRNLALRMNGLYDRMLEYLEETAGERCELVVRAMIRLRDWELASAPACDADWERNMLELLRKLYPQKFEAQGEEANRSLLRESLGKCAVYQLRSPEGRALFSILMFMLGSGFDHDPLHPWAARVLGEDGGERDRVTALYGAARAHLEESLTGD